MYLQIHITSFIILAFFFIYDLLCILLVNNLVHFASVALAETWSRVKLVVRGALLYRQADADVAARIQGVH